MSRFIRDLLSVARSKGVVIVCSVAKGIILARWLGPEQIGVLTALMVYPALLMSVGSLGLQQSTTYFLGKQLRSEEEIKRAIVQTWCLSTTLSLISCFVLIRYLSSSGDALLLVILAIAPIPFALFNKYNGGLFLGKNDIQAYNRINWIPAALGLAVVVLLVVVLDAGLPGAMLAALAGPVFMSTLLIIRHDFLRSISLRFDWDLIRQLLSLGAVYAIALMIINLNYRLDVILLDRLSSDYHVGIYSKGVGPIEYMWEIPMLLSTIIFARSATSRNDSELSRNVHKLLRISILAISVASLVLAAFANQVIVLLYGELFKPSAAVLLALVPGVVSLTIFKVLNMDLAGKGKPWISMKAMVPALVVNVVLNIILIPDYGAVGAALASTVSYSTAAILFLVFYARTIRCSAKEILRYRKSDFDTLRRLLNVSSSMGSR